MSYHNGEANSSGLKMPEHEGQNFEAQSTLGFLRLGFFNDINIPTYGGCFEITITINLDNNVLFRWKGLKKDGTADPESPMAVEGKVTINTFFSLCQ
jgi:hypothetical protein